MTGRGARTGCATGVLLAVVAALAVSGCTAGSDGSASTPAATSGPAPAATIPSAATTPSDSSTTASPSTVPPPYIARVAWVTDAGDAGRRILRVYPTPAGRAAALAGATEAWAEVLRYAADAATPGMQAQFDCHWTFARIVDPDKTSWNLEPWRPVVSQAEMQRSRCNPGGAEETVPVPTR